MVDRHDKSCERAFSSFFFFKRRFFKLPLSVHIRSSLFIQRSCIINSKVDCYVHDIDHTHAHTHTHRHIAKKLKEAP